MALCFLGTSRVVDDDVGQGLLFFDGQLRANPSECVFPAAAVASAVAVRTLVSEEAVSLELNLPKGSLRALTASFKLSSLELMSLSADDWALSCN